MGRGGTPFVNNNTATVVVDDDDPQANIVDAITGEQGPPGPAGPAGPAGPVMQIRFVVKAVSLIDDYDADNWNDAIANNTVIAKAAV